MESSIFWTSLNSEHYRLTQMLSTDFDALYAVAKDPAIWAQHPESNRWQEAMFRRFFAAGLANPEGFFLSLTRVPNRQSDLPDFTGSITVSAPYGWGTPFWHGLIGVGERMRRLSKPN